MEENRMLVAGGTGVAAQELISVVADTPGWSVTGLSRNPPASAASDFRFVAADLQDRESCQRAVAAAAEGGGFTHLVYAARAKHALYTKLPPNGQIGIEEVGPNLDMLRNIVDACDGLGEVSALRHVHAVAGGKWYGIHLGPFKTPARESDAGHLPPNFYFAQQQFLETESPLRGWTWSTSRPNIISGITPGYGTNLLSTLGVYAAICKHLGRAFDFPGRPGNFTSLQEMTETRQLAEAIFWMCRTPGAQNNAYNVINGDLIRWQDVWPLLAEHFGMKPGTVRSFPLVQWMADKGPIWDEIVSEHELVAQPIESVASWGFADFVLSWDYDVISSTTKIRQAGFHRTVDTETMILDQLREYRRRRLLP